jgi:hypothetical protein
MSRAVPTIDDIQLDPVLVIRQRTRARIDSTPVVGLAGDVQQRLGRASHEVELRGLIHGEDALDKLDTLQDKLIAGDEVDFTADITTALEIAKMVVIEAEFEELAGHPNRFEYRLVLRESPPLPEPASLAPFGGLEGFDTGFDTDLLGDIADIAGDLQGAMEMLGDVMSGLEALAGLAGLDAGNPLQPMQDQAGSLGDSGAGAGAASAGLRGLTEGS